MSQESLRRLREDLHTLQAATGLGFPYEPAHVRTAYVFAVSACAAAVLAWLARGFELGWRVAAEAALVFVPVGIYAHLRKISPPADARQVRQLSGFTSLFLAIAVGSVALVVWLVRSRSLTGAYAIVIIGAIFGTHCLTVAARDKRLRSWYFAGIGAVAMPIAYLLTGLPLDFLIAVTLAGAVAGRALVWRSQLRALGRWS